MNDHGTPRAGAVMNGLAALIVLTAFVIGAYVYPQLPDVVVTHWDASGEPDGFRQKGFWSVFGLLTIVSGTLIGLVALDLLFVRRSERLVPAERSVYSIGIGYLNLSTVVLFVWLSMLTWFELEPGALLIAFALLSSVPLLVIVGLYLPAMTKQRKAQLGPNEPSLDPTHWRLGGIFYDNPNDPRVFVPKPPHTGTGWTTNLATRGGRLFMLGMAVVLVGALILPFVL